VGSRSPWALTSPAGRFCTPAKTLLRCMRFCPQIASRLSTNSTAVTRVTSPRQPRARPRGSTHRQRQPAACYREIAPTQVAGRKRCGVHVGRASPWLRTRGSDRHPGHPRGDHPARAVAPGPFGLRADCQGFARAPRRHRTPREKSRCVCRWLTVTQ
jgi:hypothetical protein